MPEFFSSLEHTWYVLAAAIGLMSLYIKWRRDRDMMLIAGNGHEIDRLWLRIGQLETDERKTETVIEAMRTERHKLAGENQALTLQRDELIARLKDQTAEIEHLRGRVTALEGELGQLKGASATSR